ncbi:hypothetical protein AaE_015323 [Aphanomyces astaci]|nr:hypothetical protein AaE_015323 [Aphanomyces astaci]
MSSPTGPQTTPVVRNYNKRIRASSIISTQSWCRSNMSSPPLLFDDEIEGTGMWTNAEHLRFMEGVAMFPKGPWKCVADHVQTRTVRQIRTHAQKYREKKARHLRGLRQKVHPSPSASFRNSNYRYSSDSDDGCRYVDPVAVDDVGVVSGQLDMRLDPLPYSCSPIQLDECVAFLLEAFTNSK